MLKYYLSLIRIIRKSPCLLKAIWQVRCSFHAVQRHILVRRHVIEGGPLIENAILNARPLATGKMGSIEASALHIYLKRQAARKNSRRIPSYNRYIFHKLYVNSGVFPQKEEVYDQWGSIYLDAVRNCDILVAWDVAGEAGIFRNYCQKATFIKFYSLEPYFSITPWSRALKGKRVLVISPFVDSIKKQYMKREELWDNPELLPSFELLTLRAPFSAALAPPEGTDWFEALAQLKLQMDTIDYDVALIGVGAFSLPLVFHAKNKGKIGIHLGGSLQFLFGVIGNRWTKDRIYKGFIKPSWRNPSREETPSNIRIIEEGCYW